MTNIGISNVHPELFHYTSEKGLYGILETQYLRATHWRHLNDERELLHFYDVLPDFIMPELVRRANEIALENGKAKQWLFGQGGVDAYCKGQAKGLAEAMYGPLMLNADQNEHLFEFYVTSFCTPDGAFAEVQNHGLLSQWRYYGRDGGFALVFDTAELERLMEREHSLWSCRLSCGDVGYSSDSQEVLAKHINALPTFLDAFKKCQFDSQEEWAPLLEPLLDCCIHYKHWAFAEEKEVRLVVILNSQMMLREHELAGTPAVERERHHFLTPNQLQVPCLHLFEGLEVDRACRLPIRKIIVGPGPSQKQREATLRIFLRDAGYEIEVSCSCIPIRF